MKLIVGLGNPGSRYERTRHNVGWMVVDLLGTEFGVSLKTSSQFKGYFCKTKFKNDDLLLLKPLTYMNLSGEAVVEVVRWFKIELENVLVIHDDVALPLGKIRVQHKGGAGGQHGIESIIDEVADDSFDRLKVGVGPDPGGERRADYVLSEVPDDMKELFKESLDLAAKGAMTWLQSGCDVAANRFNGRNIPKEKEEKLRKEEEKRRKLEEQERASEEPQGKEVEPGKEDERRKQESEI